MKIKKRILIIVVIILIVFSGIYIFKYFNNINTFKKYLNYSTQLVSNKLENDTISGIVSFKVNVTGYLNKNNKIIDDTNYKMNYQINLKEGNAIFNVEGLYGKKVLSSDVYINENKMYISLKDIFDKYITYENKNLNLLNYTSDYCNIISILNNELSKLLEPKHFIKTSIEDNNITLTKITLDLTKDYYIELKEKLIKKLSENKKFMKSYSNIYGKNVSNSELILIMQNIDMSDYKISLYVTKNKRKFVKFEINSEEVDFNIEYKNNKYYFQYYLRDGLINEGYFKLANNNIKEFNFSNILNNYSINLKFDKLEINYGKKVDLFNEIDSNKVVYSSNLTEQEKDIIKKNNQINTIYKNYLNRYYIETEGNNEIDEELENTNEENIRIE